MLVGLVLILLSYAAEASWKLPSISSTHLICSTRSTGASVCMLSTTDSLHMHAHTYRTPYVLLYVRIILCRCCLFLAAPPLSRIRSTTPWTSSWRCLKQGRTQRQASLLAAWKSRFFAAAGSAGQSVRGFFAAGSAGHSAERAAAAAAMCVQAGDRLLH
jgi:hypothetical protein